ncbi:hypothetical protein GCM10009111_18210 [Colwellia asteriadis]|uniref:Uncharacterized protein n=1 Tax=Colwellia asteriadis TaxID=517723 RepID=A0ABP3WJK5_9GAMM
MNIAAFIIALIGALVVFGGFFFSKRLESKVKSGALRVISAIGGFLLIPLIITATGLLPSDSVQAGKYFFYIMIIGIILSLIFGRKKSVANS